MMTDRKDCLRCKVYCRFLAKTGEETSHHRMVEQELMKFDEDNNKFHPCFPVSKLRTCLTWNAAKEKGLFDKTEE